jgi:enoyl-[acyl-carrier-protein] reductase (NADH)
MQSLQAMLTHRCSRTLRKNFLKTLQPLGGISEVADIVDAVVYLTEAKQVTGEVLHVDGGAHVGRW